MLVLAQHQCPPPPSSFSRSVVNLSDNNSGLGETLHIPVSWITRSANTGGEWSCIARNVHAFNLLMRFRAML